MSPVVDLLTPVLVAVALVVAGAVLVRTRSPRVALSVLLDLLLVVGLLRLTGSDSWGAIAVAGLVVVVRQVVGAGLGQTSSASRIRVAVSAASASSR